MLKKAMIALACVAAVALIIAIVVPGMVVG
jgi:hypothetical protein